MAAIMSAADVAQFRSTGFVLKPQFFSTAEAAAMRRTVDEFQQRGLMASILLDPAMENLQMAWLSLHSRLFQVLPWEPRVIEAVDALLCAAGVEVQYDQLFRKPGRTGAGTSFHTDNAYFKLRDPLKGVGMWIALDDSTVENGTLHCASWAPGQAAPAHSKDPEQFGGELAIDDPANLLQSATPCELPAGGVCFFCYGLPHCTLANLTLDPRSAVAYHFVDSAEVDAGAGVSPNPHRYITGRRASGGLREHGGWGSGGGPSMTAAESWAAEVAAAHKGEFVSALPFASSEDRAAAAERMREDAAAQAERRGLAAL